ncbi:MAG: hypothetical protein HPY68_07305, partial [Candidatus Atribacteria bacterium]|nr:hypothetical protein [Candidatus Atribacteria bacterium]
WEKLDVAIVGAGDPRLGKVPVPQFFFSDPVSAKILAKEGVVGDLLCHFLEHDGSLSDPVFDRRVMSIPLSWLKKVPCVLGVIGLVEKKHVLQAVLRGGYINVLITDAETARAVLEEKGEGGERGGNERDFGAKDISNNLIERRRE